MTSNQSSGPGTGGDALPAPRLSSCPKRWEEMSGDKRTRFCDHCNLHVHNLSEMPRIEAEVLMNPGEARVCVTYIPDAEGNVLTLEQRQANAAVAVRRDAGCVGANPLADAAELEAEALETEAQAIRTDSSPLARRWERLGPNRWSFPGLLAGLAAGFAGLLSAHAATPAAPATSASSSTTSTAFATTVADKGEKPQPQEKGKDKPLPEPPPVPPGTPVPTPPETNKPRPPVMGKICPPARKQS